MSTTTNFTPSSIEATRILDDLLNLRLYETENVDWIEKAIITRLWLAADAEQHISTDLTSLLEWLSGTLEKLRDSLSGTACHAAQTVLVAYHVQSSK